MIPSNIFHPRYIQPRCN